MPSSPSLSWLAGCPHYCQSTSGLAVPGSCTALCPLCPASTSLPDCCHWWALWELLNPLENLITLHLQPRRPEQRKRGGRVRRITRTYVPFISAPAIIQTQERNVCARSMVKENNYTSLFFFFFTLRNICLSRETWKGVGWEPRNIKKSVKAHRRKAHTHQTEHRFDFPLTRSLSWWLCPTTKQTVIHMSVLWPRFHLEQFHRGRWKQRSWRVRDLSPSLASAQ